MSNNNNKGNGFFIKIFLINLNYFVDKLLSGLKEIPKINKYNQQRVRFLIAPLDWGLGHATRCIPLVRFLESLDCEIIIAADGDQLRLLQLEFAGHNS